MHDPLIVAFDIPRPWPQRSGFRAAPDGVRWRLRLQHEHWTDGPDSCGCPSPDHNPFPWWRPRSYGHFWRLAGRDYYWPPVVTVWHREPGGADGLSVCGRNPDGTRNRRWKLHVHHWRLQFPPLQQLRRRLLTRCEYCGGRSTKTHPVNVSNSWDRRRGHWWQGENGLHHAGCRRPPA